MSENGWEQRLDKLGQAREESIDMTPGVVWTDAQLSIVRDLAARAAKARAAVKRVEALHRPWHWGSDRKAVVGEVAPEGSESATFCLCSANWWSGSLLYDECPTRRAVDGTP